MENNRYEVLFKSSKMKNVKFNLKCQLVIFGVAAMLMFSAKESQGQTAPSKSTPSYTHRLAGNPYLPLWEHLPDGEPRVFEDPDNPGKYRAYIIGRHPWKTSPNGVMMAPFSPIQSKGSGM
jgi:hypothetical protein